MSQPDFYAILDQCVSRMRQGESPEACLADYPSVAGELGPDLVLTAELIHLSPLEPAPQAVEDGYQRMMAAFDHQEEDSPLASLAAFKAILASLFGRPQRGFAAGTQRFAAIAAVILVVAASLVVTASADTLPGDVLYPVKRSWENARLTLTIDDSSREALRSEFERRRREEVQAVQELRRPVVVEFKGVVESVVDDAWQVDGLALTITGDTQMQGDIGLGKSVTVRAQVKDDGSLIALRIVADDTRPVSRATPAYTPRPTQTSRPAQRAINTPSVVAPSPTPSAEKTRPEPTPTASRNVTDRPTPEPTATRTPSVDRAPTVDGAPTVNGELTREPQPTNTPSTDSLATSAPRATATPVKTDPTPTATRRTSDVAPTPTATSKPPDRDKVPTPTPTATRNTDTDGRNDRPP